MNFVDHHFSKKNARSIILAVTIGNFLEWYEIYLYVYWAPIISKLFFKESNLESLTYTFFIFAIGFLARPIGGLVFGRIGDKIGRKKSLLLSMGIMTIPSFVTGLLPTYDSIGIAAPWILAIMRFLQAFPAGGEIPGAFCYLYESSPWPSRHYISSWAVWGFQIGILISTIECFLLERCLNYETLIDWGWRFSFILGGVLGLLGLCLRYRLHETPLFQEMHTHEHIVKEPILHAFYRNRVGIFKGILFCAFNSSSFYLITINFPIYLGEALGIDFKDNLIITMLILILMTLPLPVFGKMGDLLSNKLILITSVLGMIFLLYPMYLAIQSSSIPLMIVTLFLFCLFFSCNSALIPYIVADLFSTHDRFTCSALSFNIADAIIGGFTPALALSLLNKTDQPGSFVWILLFVALLSLSGYLYLKPRRTHLSHH